MTTVVIGAFGLGLLLVILLARMPIGLAMAAVGFGGFAVIRGMDGALGLLGSIPYQTFSSYSLSVAPLFILMGYLCFHAGISTDLYKTVRTWMGHLRGGLAMATVGACGAFAAISGSSMATAITMGTVALPEMRKYKYNSALATGVIAAGGTIGVLIPPSMGFIFYGVITETSISRLFMAGIIPGVLEAVFYMATIYIVCRINPGWGPPGPRSSYIEKFRSLKDTWIVLALFLLVIGGIYFGIFSPTEAAGAGAFGAFVFSLATRKLSWGSLCDAFTETVKVGGMILLILTGANLLNTFLAVSRLPFELGAVVGDLPMNRYLILMFILCFFLVLGCLMDPLSVILLTMPIFFPLVSSMGFDPIWFGVLVTRMGEIGAITPPVGLNVFVIKGVADVPMSTMYKGVTPFIIADILHVTLLIVFPQLSLYLPQMMFQ